MHQRDLRIRRILEDLKERMYIHREPVAGLEISPRGENAFKPFENGALWGGEGEWWDFRVHAQVPASFTGAVLLAATTGYESGWEAVNPQFVVKQDGKIIQALDTRHTTCLLMDKAVSGTRIELELNAYAADVKQPPRLYLELCDRDDEVMGLVYDISVPWEAVKLMPEHERERETTLFTLCEAINMLDLRKPHSPEFNASVKAAREYLRTEYYEKRAQLPAIAYADCVGHTHIDVAWLWDLYQTRHKAVRSFATVLHLMEQYPEYKFMSSQPVLYKFVKEDAPELYERIKKAIADGRWEPEGGMWVEADCNISSGEALVRQFLYGKKFFREEFGKDNRILWLPDVFGYSAALPQIMKLCDVDYFMTSKLSWSEYNLYPYDTFWWKGIDGTKVLTHFTPSRQYNRAEVGDLQHFTTYNAMLNPEEMKGGWQRFQQKGLDNEFLVSYGFGDGGGGPTDWMLENGRRMAVPLPEVPVVRQEFPSVFFDTLNERVKNAKDMPQWDGELYLEYHRGTYTAIAKNKRNNRKTELLLREVELWRERAWRLKGLEYPKAVLDDIWEEMLTLQFHDILPGSSIEKVYQDSDEMYADITVRLNALLDEALAVLASDAKGDIAAYNSLSYARDDVIWFDGPEGVTALRDAAGNEYPAQRDKGRYCAFVRGLAPMASTPLWFVKGEASSERMAVDKNGFETPFYKGTFDAAMRIPSLFDKRAGRELAREPLNRIVCYENKPHNYDAWDINIYYDQRFWEVDDVRKVEILSEGPVLTRVRVVYAYMDSLIAQDIVLYHDLPRIDFETEVEWKEVQYMLKAHFPTNLFYEDAAFDIQYGNVRRATHKNTSWDRARFEVCAHKWADIAEEGYGLSVLNDCKYGYSVDENSIALTMLKSSAYPNPHGDQEHHTFTYSILPHEGTWREGGTVEQAYQLNIPVRVFAAGNGQAELACAARVDQPGVLVEAFKRAEDGKHTAIRLYECFGRRRKGVRLEANCQSAQECNAIERVLGDAVVDNGAIVFDLRPYEIKTFLI